VFLFACRKSAAKRYLLAQKSAVKKYLQASNICSTWKTPFVFHPSLNKDMKKMYMKLQKMYLGTN